MEDISVLVCDDSALMRNLVSRIVNDMDGMNVVGTALNGKFCLEKIASLKPDVVILDLEMPVMNGIECLKERRKLGLDVPVIILSSIAKEGAAVTMEALELGASDFVTKPGGSISVDIASVSSDLISRIASYGGMYARIHGKSVWNTDYFIRQLKMRDAESFVAKQKGPMPFSSSTSATEKKPAFSATDSKKSDFLFTKQDGPKTPPVITPTRPSGKIDVIAIGISTGGPNALRQVFKDLSPDLKQPVLVVQHMPAGFTGEFAASLDRLCPLPVREANDGDVLEGGHVYLAPGDNHIYVEMRATGNVIRLSQDAPMNGHRPSAGYMFKSIAKVYQNRALAVIMTGMGRDGAAEITDLRKEGAWTLGQDEKTSIVYGMPKVAWELGGVQKQVALEDMAQEINTLAKDHFH